MALDLSVQTGTAQKFVAAAVAPKMAYEGGERTNRQATDRQSGLPLWRVSVFVMDEESSRTPTQLSVTVPAATAPALPQLAPVRFEGLRVLMWAGGASLRADSVEPLADSVQSTSSFLSDIEEVER